VKDSRLPGSSLRILNALERSETNLVSDLQFVAERLVLYRITKVREKIRELDFLSKIITEIIVSSRGASGIPVEVSKLNTLGIREGQKLYEHFDDIVSVLEVLDSSELYKIIEQLRAQPLQAESDDYP